MSDIVAVSAVTIDLNIPMSDQALIDLQVIPGSNVKVSDSEIRRVLRGAVDDDSHLFPASGGSVSNTLDLMSRAGLNCGLYGVGGNDHYGRHFLGDCERAGVKLLPPLEDGLTTGHNLCFRSENGRSTIVWTSGANDFISPNIIVEEVIRNAELVVIDGFTFGFGRNGPQTVEHTVNLAMKHGVQFVLTLGSIEILKQNRECFEQFIPRAFLFAGNLEQVATLIGLSADSDLSSVQSNSKLPKSNFLITLGDKGVWVRVNGRDYYSEPLSTAVVDTTGAGDAFLAGFLTGIKRGWTVEKTIYAGNLLAAKVIGEEGARIPYDQSVKDLL